MREISTIMEAATPIQSFLGKMEVEYTPIDTQSFILGAILGFICSIILLLVAVLVIWLVRKTK